MQLGARYLGLAQLHTSGGVYAVHRKDVLGEIDSNVQNGHDFPFQVS